MLNLRPLSKKDFDLTSIKEVKFASFREYITFAGAPRFRLMPGLKKASKSFDVKGTLYLLCLQLSPLSKNVFDLESIQKIKFASLGSPWIPTYAMTQVDSIRPLSLRMLPELCICILLC